MSTPVAISAIQLGSAAAARSVTGAQPTSLRARAALGELARSGGDEQNSQAPASQLLSQLFFAPLLAEMRKLPFGKTFASGGRAEEIFGEQLDQRVADIAAARSLKGLSGRIAAKLSRQADKTGGVALPSGHWDTRLAAERTLPASRSDSRD